MADKQDLKHSEARIIVYLATVDDSKCYPKAMSGKLDIDYSYILNILGMMTAKGWIKKTPSVLRSYYNLTKFAPLDTAKEQLAGGKHEIKKDKSK